MSITLTPSQRRDVERARALLEASYHPATLGAYVEQSGHPGGRGDDAPYVEAFALAAITIGDLLRVIDGLTGGAS